MAHPIPSTAAFPWEKAWGKVRVIRPEAEHHRGILLLNLILIVSASHRVRVSVTHIILPMGKVQTCPILWETAFRTGMAAVNPLVSAVARHIPKEILPVVIWVGAFLTMKVIAGIQEILQTRDGIKDNLITKAMDGVLEDKSEHLGAVFQDLTTIQIRLEAAGEPQVVQGYLAAKVAVQVTVLGSIIVLEALIHPLILQEVAGIAAIQQVKTIL